MCLEVFIKCWIIKVSDMILGKVSIILVLLDTLQHIADFFVLTIEIKILTIKHHLFYALYSTYNRLLNIFIRYLITITKNARIFKYLMTYLSNLAKNYEWRIFLSE